MNIAKDIATYRFETPERAYSFLRKCDLGAIPASYSDDCTARVEIATRHDRVRADSLAGSAPYVAYEFCARK